MIKLNYPNFWKNKSLISLLLLPFSLIYYLLSRLRPLLNSPVKLSAPVICIGNATVGGTGKTQVVIWLAERLLAQGLKPVIVSKGYGGTFNQPIIVEQTMGPELVGDEALELSEYATTIVAKNPAKARPVLEKLSHDVILVDDGMQNPGFAKDFIIMVVDGARGFGNRMIFPAGPMRQSVESAIEAADTVITTNIKKVDPIIKTSKAFDAIISLSSDLDKTIRYYAFAGIGNPERFFELCKTKLGNIVKTKSFPDHHIYSDSDIKKLLDDAARLGAKLITTRKDYVKLKSYKNIMPVKVKLAIEKEQEVISSIIKRVRG